MWHSDKSVNESSINTARKVGSKGKMSVQNVAVAFLFAVLVNFHQLHSKQLCPQIRRNYQLKGEGGGETRGKDEGGNRGWTRVVKENQFTR